MIFGGKITFGAWCFLAAIPQCGHWEGKNSCAAIFPVWYPLITKKHQASDPTLKKKKNVVGLPVEGLGRWCPLEVTQPTRCTRYKGYVHQSNHAPAALQAEALCVQVLVYRQTQTHNKGRLALTTATAMLPLIQNLRLVMTLLRTFFSSLAVISMSCHRSVMRTCWEEFENPLNFHETITHISSYLLKNRSELLVFLALLSRWCWRWLCCCHQDNMANTHFRTLHTKLQIHSQLK